MDYLAKLKYHYKPQKGWVNDPNGLVYFGGYYHIFYQHSPNFEQPWHQPMHWGHARTKDFLTYEELPVALYPDCDYDCDGCWSGTAVVKNETLYLLYASVKKVDGRKVQTMSVAYSKDGIHFEKYAGNPAISAYPVDGGPDFRDPAVCEVDGEYYCVMATGHVESKTGRLLLYKSHDLLSWKYEGVMHEWEGCVYTECPSLMRTDDGFLLTASICPIEKRRYFCIMYGRFDGHKYLIDHTAEVDKGPDQYAGQVFSDKKGRKILVTWIPGWKYIGYAQKDVGCMSIPREIKSENGKITAYPVEELRHLLRDSDDAVKRTEKGFIVERTNREPLVYEGEIRDIKILRDEFILEIFVNGGEEVYSVLL